MWNVELNQDLVCFEIVCEKASQSLGQDPTFYIALISGWMLNFIPYPAPLVTSPPVATPTFPAYNWTRAVQIEYKLFCYYSMNQGIIQIIMNFDIYSRRIIWVLLSFKFITNRLEIHIRCKSFYWMPQSLQYMYNGVNKLQNYQGLWDSTSNSLSPDLRSTKVKSVLIY